MLRTLVRVIALRTLREFWARQPQAELPLRGWYQVVDRSAWRSPVDVKATFRHASVINAQRIVFNVGGNKYRVVAHINFRQQILYVRFVGSHAEYDKVNATTI